MTIKHALMTMAAPLALLASPADAAIFDFDLGGAFTGSFRIDTARNFPSTVEAPNYFETVASGMIDGVTSDSHIVAFNGTTFDGGLTLGDNFTNLWGEQLFTGTLAAPTLRTGSFTLLADGVPGRTVSVNISQAVAAVPESATWAMMIVGFGAIGLAMRRRRVTTRVTFA